MLPELGGEQAGEGMMLGDAGEAGSGERGGVVGQVGGAQASEQTEGQIEAADIELRREVHGAVGDAEVGDEPECSRGERGRNACDEGIEVGLDEAVEKEVGNGEVAVRRRREGASVAVMGVKAGCGDRRQDWAERRCSAAKKFEHDGAGVDRVGFDGGVLSEQACEEAAIAVAEDECVAAVRELREEVEAAALEGSAEGEVFEPAVGASDAVEVGGGGHQGLRKGTQRSLSQIRNSSGVSRARSAAARRVMGWNTPR